MGDARDGGRGGVELGAEENGGKEIGMIEGTGLSGGLDGEQKIDLDSKIFLGQPVALSFAWTCSVLSILHVSNFKVLAQIL